MTRSAIARQPPRSAARRPPRPRLRVLVSGFLLAVSVAAFAAGLGLVALRRELRARDDGDTRPCPPCRSPAILDGRSLTDEQGQRLLFASPQDAARYAADYARARDAARWPSSPVEDGGGRPPAGGGGG